MFLGSNLSDKYYLVFRIKRFRSRRVVLLCLQNFPAENLLKGDSFKKWKAKPGDKNASVILQVKLCSEILMYILLIGEKSS